MCLGVLPQVHDPEGGYQGRLHYSKTGIFPPWAIELLQRRTICYWYISSPVVLKNYYRVFFKVPLLVIFLLKDKPFVPYSE
jgi:hypothetical protein